MAGSTSVSYSGGPRFKSLGLRPTTLTNILIIFSSLLFRFCDSTSHYTAPYFHMLSVSSQTITRLFHVFFSAPRLSSTILAQTPVMIFLVKIKLNPHHNFSLCIYFLCYILNSILIIIPQYISTIFHTWLSH
jgi:hypothetical protein